MLRPAYGRLAGPLMVSSRHWIPSTTRGHFSRFNGIPSISPFALFGTLVKEATAAAAVH